VLREKWRTAFPVQRQDVRPERWPARSLRKWGWSLPHTLSVLGRRKMAEEAGPCPHPATRDDGAIAPPSAGRALAPERIAR
jgi:hypothetical protein